MSAGTSRSPSAASTTLRGVAGCAPAISADHAAWSRERPPRAPSTRALDLVDHQVLDQHSVARGRDPDCARAHPRARSRANKGHNSHARRQSAGRASSGTPSARRASRSAAKRDPRASTRSGGARGRRGSPRGRRSSIDGSGARVTSMAPGRTPSPLTLGVRMGANGQTPPAPPGWWPWPRSRAGGVVDDAACVGTASRP